MLSIITFTNKNRYPKNQSGLVTGSQLNATGQSGRQSNSAALLGLLPGGRRRGSSAEFKDPGGSGVAQQRSGISLTLFPSACARRRKPPGVSSRGHCTPPPGPHRASAAGHKFVFISDMRSGLGLCPRRIANERMPNGIRYELNGNKRKMNETPNQNI